MMKTMLTRTLGGALLLASMGASAAFVTTGGTSFTLNNNGNFNPNGSGNSYVGQTGTISSKVEWTGPTPTTWNFEYIGKEAGFNNAFQFTNGNNGWNTIFTTGGSSPSPSPSATASSSVPSFAFSFLSNSREETRITNMNNPVNAPSFWAQVSGDGNSLVLWFSDGGGGDDRDFDDMGVKISASAVPIPAALPLFLSALAGLGMLGFSRRAV